MKKHTNYLWILAAFLILLIAYLPVVQKLIFRWSQGNYNYCDLVPFLFLYLCWEKRKNFDFTLFSGSYAGLIFLFLAICISLIGSLASLETFLYFGFYISLVSLGLTLYGKRLKHLIFPLIILFFIIPLPPFINRLLTFKFQLLTSSLTVFLLRLSGISVFHEGNIIDLGITQLQVAEACSGLRYFMPMILLGLLIGYYFLRSLSFRILLLIFVPLISIVANAFRVYLLALFHIKGYERLAQGFSHYFAGWLVFVLAIILLVLIALLLRMFENKIFKYKRSETKTSLAFKKCVLPSKKFSTLILLFSLFTAIGGIGLYLFPKTFIVPKKVDFSHFPLSIDGWYDESLKLPPKILKSLWADEYVYNIYRKKDFPGIIHLFIPYYYYQTAWHTAHTPQSCILGGGWFIIRSGIWKLRVYSDKIIPIKYMWLKKGNKHMLATYFFLQNGRVIISPWWHKFYLLWDGLFHRRTDGALVRVEMLLNNNISALQAEYELKKFLLHLWPILNKFVGSGEG